MSGWTPSLRLWRRLLSLLPAPETPDPYWASEREELAARLVAEARWVANEITDPAAVTKPKRTLRKEAESLRSAITKAERRLRGISPGLDRLLGLHPHPYDVADDLGALIEQIDSAERKIPRLPQAQREVEAHAGVVDEFALRVLRTLKEFDIAPSATYDPYFFYTSKAVETLQALGYDIGLDRDTTTWKAVVLRVKKQDPDLQ